jgi:GntR family transcriptional regulator
MSSSLAAGNPTLNPLYKEVKIRLTRSLVAGEWKPGEAIPSEARLAERFDVSVGTIRKAIDELVAERILVRQQGRGTFVAIHSEDRTLYYFFHIVGKDGSKAPPTHELMSFRRARADAEAEQALGLTRGERVLCASNVLRLAGEPVILDEMVIPARLCPNLDEATFAGRQGTIYGLYQERYGISVVRISERLSAVPAPARVADVLGLRPLAPVLLIRRVAYTYHDAPVELRTSWVNTRHHEYLSDLWKNEAR